MRHAKLQEILEGALAVKKRGEALEYFAQSQEEEVVAVVQNQLREASRKESQGVGARVVRRGQMGFAATSSLDTLSETTEEARALLPHSEPVPLSFPRELKSTWKGGQPSFVSANALSRLGLRAQEVIRVGEPKGVVDVRLVQSRTQVAIANSRGLRASFEKTRFTKMVSCVLAQENLLQVYEAEAGTSPAILRAPVEKRVLQKLQMAQKKVRLREKVDWVIFAPKAVEHLLAPLRLALSGSSVVKKISPICGQVGKRLFDPRFSLTDDPRAPEGLFNQPCDGEGVASPKLPLIWKGRVQNILLDLKTSSLLKQKSNGRGGRSAFSLPSPSPTNWTIAPGALPLKKALASGLCLVVDQAIGWAGNPLSGALAFTVELGFIWKDGECLGRCSDVMLSGNIFEALQSEVLLTKEREWAFGEILTPYIGVKNITCTQGG